MPTICVQQNRKLGMGCTSHHIREEDIYKAVFSAINSYCMNVADLADKIDGVSEEDMIDVHMKNSKA